MTQSGSLLEVHNLGMRFGGLIAVDGIELNLRPKEIFAIIGPNGAGKTTVFNCISGFYRPSSGRIALEGKDIAGLGSHTVATHGLVRTFQNVRLFKNMTALENLLVAQHRHLRTSLLAGLFKTRMITRPRLLMLDEPAAGLNPQEKFELQGLIQRLRQEHKVTVLLIEHDMSLVMGVSERILVMEYGKPIALGTPDAIRSDERVIKAYLGDE